MDMDFTAVARCRGMGVLPHIKKLEDALGISSFRSHGGVARIGSRT